MRLRHRIPLLPADPEMVSVHLAVTRDGGQLAVLNASGPIFTCREDVAACCPGTELRLVLEATQAPPQSR